MRRVLHLVIVLCEQRRTYRIHAFTTRMSSKWNTMPKQYHFTSVLVLYKATNVSYKIIPSHRTVVFFHRCWPWNLYIPPCRNRPKFYHFHWLSTLDAQAYCRTIFRTANICSCLSSMVICSSLSQLLQSFICFFFSGCIQEFLKFLQSPVPKFQFIWGHTWGWKTSTSCPSTLYNLAPLWSPSTRRNTMSPLMLTGEPFFFTVPLNHIHFKVTCCSTETSSSKYFYSSFVGVCSWRTVLVNFDDWMR